MNINNKNDLLEGKKKDIENILNKITNDYKTNIIVPNILIELKKILYLLKKAKFKTDYIYKLTTREHLNLFRVSLNEEGIRTIVLKITIFKRFNKFL